MRIQRSSFNRLFTFLLLAGLLFGLGAPRQAAAAETDAPAALVTVIGVLRDGTPGGHTYPLYAKIVFASASLTPFAVFTNPFTGAYTASLVLNEAVTATITPTLPGYPSKGVTFTPTTNPFTMDFSIAVDLAGCYATGYTNNKVFLEDFEVAVPPALPSGWTQSKIGNTSTASWATASASVFPLGIAPFSGLRMLVFNSYSATSGDSALLYTTKSANLTSQPTPALSFGMYHDSGNPTNTDRVQAYVSTNGATFYPVGSAIQRYSATPGWVFHSVDISAYAGQPAVYIGLVGTSANGGDIHIDDIAIGSATCSKMAGGLVTGFVSGAPGGRPILSALVANTTRPAEQIYTQSRGEDSGLRDGFYQLYSTVSGAQTYTATAIRYQYDQQTVNVAADGVTRLDLAPTSGWLRAGPNRAFVTLPVNSSTSLPLTLSNTGQLGLSFTLQPAAGLLSSGSTLLGPFPYQEEPASGPTLSRDEQPAAKTPQTEAPAAPGELAPQGGSPRTYGITTPFPGTARYRFATASCDGETFYVIGGQTGSTAVDEVWKYNPADNSWTPKAALPVASANMRAACIDGLIYVVGGYASPTWKNTFQIYDTQANTWTNTTQPFTGGPMLAAYNGLLYSFGGATPTIASNQASVYNPGSGTWSSLATMPTAAAYAGVVVYKNKIFIIGGADTADVQVYNPAANSWDNSGPDLPGPRMDPVVGWYGDSIYLLNGGGNGGSYWVPYPDGYTLNAATWPASSWTSLGPVLPTPEVAPASVCANNRLWSVGGTANFTEDPITQYYDNGLMCSRTYASVPWLTPSLASGSILTGGTLPMSLGFSSTAPTNAPGVYHAVLKVNNDTPAVFSDIPVTMVVVQTSAFLSATPQSASGTAYPGKSAAYTFTITNKSGSTDSFSMYFVGASAGWTFSASGALTDIPNNGTRTVSVWVWPLAGNIKDGDVGDVTLGVMVHDNASRFVTFSTVTTFQHYLVLVPCVKK